MWFFKITRKGNIIMKKLNANDIVRKNYETYHQYLINILEELKNNIINENYENINIDNFSFKESLEYLSFLKKYADKNNVQVKSEPEQQKDNCDYIADNNTRKNNFLHEPKAVSMFALSGEHIKDFDSLANAARYIIEHNDPKGKLKSISNGINDVCKQKRKTAYGYVWCFA